MKYKLGRCNVSYLPECTFGYFQLSVCSLPSLIDAIVLVQIVVLGNINIHIEPLLVYLELVRFTRRASTK